MCGSATHPGWDHGRRDASRLQVLRSAPEDRKVARGRYDAVMVGAGPACLDAAYLAKAGLGR
jgi:ribulose 1,5-bisphosphate synthetase/thiazole synthase